jgi:hypothetical protein
MTRAKSNHVQCVEACGDRYPDQADSLGFDKCCDTCDEKYAAGKEPGGDLLADLAAERSEAGE